MSLPTTLEPASRPDRLGLNPWLQRLLFIIAATVVAVIAWTVLERFMHILTLLAASLLVAFLAGPLVDRLEGRGVPRLLAILLLYLTILGAMAIGAVLLIGPLTAQLQGLVKTLPTLLDARSGTQVEIDQFLRQQGIPLSVTDMRNEIAGYISGASAELLGGTLAVLTGVVTIVTDLFLVLAITFYLLLDGRSMHSAAVRLLPERGRERWFFVKAALNRVMGGYIRGQIIVALSVGIAAGVGCALLGVQYPLVIGLLAFLFEFIPIVGPVLGSIPAVVLALFQPGPLVWWVIIFFVVLQQIESNVVVPRVSGHAVGLHPLGALLALLAGFELGGLGGALIGVPLAGMLYVVALALYSDATGQTELLGTARRGAAYSSLRQVLNRRHGTGSAVAQPSTPAADAEPQERLTAIAQDQAELITNFKEEQAAQAVARSAGGNQES